MNVLVYSGQQVNKSILTSAIASLRGILAPNYTVQSLSYQAFISQPWSPSCALLVLLACQPPSSTSIINSYIENGGRLLALSVGARGSSGNLFTNIEDLAASNDQSLRLRGGPGTGYIMLEFKYWRDDNPIYLDLKCGEECIQGVACHSPRPSLLDLDAMKGITILGRFIDSTIAGFKYSVGSGNIVVWAPHLESTISGDADKQRLSVLRRSLHECGLHIPSDDIRKTPLPQFLVGQSSIVAHIMKELSAESFTQQVFVLKDGNDSFHFHPPTHYSSLLEECQNADPSTAHPKHILVHLDGSFPSKDYTPVFDVDLYFKELSKANENHSSSDVPWGIGDALLYGDTVTSTQTMLEKNPWFLSRIPAPFLSLASHQLAGRGRGTNSWLSPAGCLQFSLLLRVHFSSIPASKLVFVQYLFALAVAEACRDKSVLGALGDCVRLKWPNDLYVLLNGELRKIGGILVNSSFSGGKAEVIIGCGLNVLTPPPIASLSQSLPSDVDLDLRMERTAATIMAKFRPMWNTFVAHCGSFEPFIDLYLQRWLHSNQIVTLTTTTPETKVRITGITSDYGLLRTIPERNHSWIGDRDGGFIDLQPDGNSFDIMSGLIKAKT